MSSKNYVGTLEIGEASYGVTGVISKKGRQLLGTVVTNTGAKEIPINFRISNSGIAFFSIGTSWFQTPLGESVALLAVETGFASITESLDSISIDATPIELDGEASTLTLELEEATQASEIEGLENEASVIKTSATGLLTPLRVNEVGNHLDHFAGMLSISRGFNETNEQLLNRIENRIAFGSGSSEKGLSEAIANTLGLSNKDSIQINIKEDSVDPKSGLAFFIAKNEVVLYREWYPIEYQNAGSIPTREMTISLSNLTLGELVDQINLSDNFKAKLLTNSEGKADFLIPISSIQFKTERLAISERMYFSKKNVLRGMLTIDNSIDLIREVEDSDALVRRGDYYIDYNEGLIGTFRAPSDQVRVGYLFNNPEFIIRSSQIYLLPFNLESSNSIHFNQVEKEFYLNESEKEINGIPTDLGYNAIRSVMTAGKFPQFWGE